MRTIVHGEKWFLCDDNGGDLVSGDPVHLLGFHGFYLVAEQDGRANANRPRAREWETWELIDINGGSLVSGDTVVLRNTAHGEARFLVAEEDGRANANRTSAGDWEAWTITFH
ncbi:fascin domain-containing protein [Nitrosomonas marina]|uniref:fascin domain-containing protein n=1 Tax=Nitrosomonas marina TaxID=917 RepID=UPI00115FDAD0|nr:hypothetical protein [Nitrosomonas marina]